MSAAPRSDIPPHRSLEMVRREIDALDTELLRLLGRRVALAREAAQIKGPDRTPRDPERVAAILAKVASRASELGIDVHIADAVWRSLLEASGDYQDRTWPQGGAEAPKENAGPEQTPSERLAPKACETMADVRQGVDALDRLLVAMIAERQGYMDAAARIKPTRTAVRDPARIEDVVAKVLEAARGHGLSPAIAEPVWRIMIERCIAHELTAWDRLRNAQPDPGQADESPSSLSS